MIYGVDLHPRFQAGISIRQVKAEGFDFIVCKLSQGTESASYEGSFPWIAEAKSLGMAALGYHYLNSADPQGQARVFVNQLTRAGVCGALDVEDGSGNIDNVHAFLAECSRLGARISLLYMPQWYWKKIGNPSLAGLPPLWSSRYPDMVAGTAAQNYSRVPRSFWNGYGGNSVAVLQFTSTARVAGHTVDANVFAGTPGEFASLVAGAPTASAALRPSPVPRTQTGFLMALNDAEQQEVLVTLRNLWQQVFMGDQPPGADHFGWPMWPGGTPERLTMVDMMRRNNVEVETIKEAVLAIANRESSETSSTNNATSVTGGLTADELTTVIEQTLLAVLNKVKLSTDH
jgi:hypothetical protein